MHKPKVLIIDEDIDFAERIRHYLTGLVNAPEDVFIYSSLADTINHKDSIPDIIIISFKLYTPALPKHINQWLPSFTYQPVILITDKENKNDALETLTRGIQDYILTDELSTEVLQKTISCAMARSRADYRKIFVESPAAMFIYERNTYQFLSVNVACQKQYGFNEDEFLQMTALQIRPEEEVTSFLDANTIVPEKYHDYGRWKHRKKNGEIFSVNIYAHDTEFNGKAARLVTAVDISRTILTEQQVMEKNREVNNILESITDGFFAVNTNGEFTYVNKQCEKIFGLKREKMIGKNIWEIHDRKEYADFYTHYQQAVERRTNMRFEGFVGILQKWLSVTAYPTKNGLAVYLVDITERRQIRQQLSNDRQQLRAILNNTSDMIWLLDQKLKIIIGNEAFRKWMKQNTSNDTMTMLPDAITANWKEHFDIAFGGQPLTFTAMETKDDSLFYQEVSLYPVFNEANEVLSISCFARDVTQQQLRIQKIQLQNQYLEKIAWMHSHEARGPVANILGLASLFEMNDPADPENKMMMELIIESSHQLDKVIRKIVADIDTYQMNYGDDE